MILIFTIEARKRGGAEKVLEITGVSDWARSQPGWIETAQRPTIIKKVWEFSMSVSYTHLTLPTNREV